MVQGPVTSFCQVTCSHMSVTVISPRRQRNASNSAPGVKSMLLPTGVCTHSKRLKAADACAYASLQPSSNPGPIALQATVLGRRLPQHNQIAATTHDRRGPREQLHILVPCSTLPSTAKLCCCTLPCHGVLLYVTVPPRRGDLAATCAPKCHELYMPTAAGSEIKNQR